MSWYFYFKRKLLLLLSLQFSFFLVWWKKKRKSAFSLLQNPLVKLYTRGYDGKNEAVHPKVLYFEKGFKGWKFWRCYTPFTETNSDVENPSIAVSQDGYKWVVPTGLSNPIVDIDSPHISFNSDPHLVYNTVSEELECWYRFCLKKGGEYIYRVRSKDGVNWSEKELLQFSEHTQQSLVCPVVLFENGKYLIWILTNDGDRFNTGGSYLKYYESEDACKWQFIRNIRVNVNADDMPWHFDVIKQENVYHMVYSTRSISDYNSLKYIVYAWSSDNMVYKSRIILEKSDRWYGWDNYKLHRPSVVLTDNRCLLYYSAQSRTYNWGTGLIVLDSIDLLKG